LIGIESRNVRAAAITRRRPVRVDRRHAVPAVEQEGGARAQRGERRPPAVILANLSGFDGSPESMRKLQLEYGAEIARAVVNFSGR
jgi:hypothetical protein